MPKKRRNYEIEDLGTIELSEEEDKRITAMIEQADSEIEAKHYRTASADEEKDIDDALGIQAVTIRFDQEVLERVKELAKQEGLIPVAYIRRLVTKHVGLSESTKKSGLRFGKYKWICNCGANIWDDDHDTDRSCVNCGLKRDHWSAVEHE